MPQRDLVAELRAARVTAPADVRERVRLIAARDTTPRRRSFTWRRALVVGLPAAAAIAATVVFTRPSSHEQPAAIPELAPTVQHGAAASGTAKQSLAPLTAKSRVQDYNASLSLRLKDADAVSDGVKAVQRITAALGGYPLSIVADVQGGAATAELVVKVPRQRVQEALRRFAALGAITAEDVRVQDLQASLNATDRTIARLQAQLKSLRVANAPPEQIARVTARIVQLQRAEAATRRTAHYATVSLHLATPAVAAPSHAHGPWHALRVALRWAGIGAVYALVFGLPVVVIVLGVAWLRRRREDALLSRS